MSQVWLITGSSRGLGLSIVKAALQAGANVIATARKPEQLQHLVDEYGASRIFPVALDVANNDDVIKAVKAGHDKFGRIDIVVNNAGYANLAATEDITVDDFRAQVDTNFLGVVYVTKAVLPILRSQGSGHIFQVSSLGGRLGSPGLCAYQASKWAVGGFSTVLSSEVASLGIKVTVLEPGGMKTDWAGSSMQTPPVSAPYKPTVGAFADMLSAMSGNEVSIPDKVAKIVVDLTKVADPPLRLLIGTDAVEYGGNAAKALTESDKKWHDVSISSV
ncbi:Oxidoreductase boa17 [Neonectria punicea]|uniref:Oxidoreductase boa17 n=1 Tax=Neonectria punicea TaxID=979145 RepID=A0ABR1HT62_9HYPO